MMLVLSGCMEGASPFGGGSDSDPVTVQPPASAKKVREEEREAPEVFSLTDQALWDGRPSLGGIWVAHRSVTTPERVIVRNTENGKSVKAALFRREREFPGPSIQMSSDAASALGALAGQPVKVSVIALRTEPLVEEPDPASASEIETKAIDPVAATAAAAIAKAEAKPTARPAKAEAKSKPAEPASTEAPAPKETAKKAEKPANMDAAAVAPKQEEKASAPKPAEPQPEATAPAASAEGGAVLSGVLEKPYIQIGTFSNEDNAKRAALELSKTGLSAVVRKVGEDAGASWRVIVGPALGTAERDALLNRVKSAGYPDAFAVGG
ncbi:SPOR domain-containing protein [Defluviimonas sp. WL0002]|uniref:SPOR domain-containing protein n=2 Tax=Albidovulum marisflavi TaxID=2984159 RepID=A0ABT2ZB60_9RHOB|nr:SPOR domain-containing protein [Defluviimonas sp. WL0002]